MATFTENGLQIEGIPEIRTKLQNKALQLFEPLVGAGNLSVDDSGVIGRILGIVSEPFANQEEILQIINTALNPDQATGLALDNVLSLNRMQRKGDRFASTYLILNGVQGLTLPDTCTVRSSKTGDLFQFTTPVTFSNIGCQGVNIEISDISSTDPFVLNYSVYSKVSSSPPIVVFPIIDETIDQLLIRINQQINSQSSYINSSISNQTLIVKTNNETDIGDFTVSSNLDISSVYMLTTAVAVYPTTVDNDPETIQTINSGANVDWIGVTNPYFVFASKGIESDSEARLRFKNIKAWNNVGGYDSINLALDEVKGVSYKNIQPNTLLNPSTNQIINKGLGITVNGGDEDEIASTLFRVLGAGTMTSGDITKTVIDINGSSHEIKFSRPDYVNIKIDLRLTILPTFPTNGIALIREAIVEYFNNLTVGEDIYYSRLFTPINSVQGFTVSDLKIAKVGFPFGTSNITIAHNQLAVIDFNDITTG